MNVWWVSLHPDILARGYADQGIVEALLAGNLWRTTMPPFDHHERELPPPASSGVVVIPARWHIEDVEAIRAALERMAWALVILTGDEESGFPWERLRLHHTRVWVQTPRPDIHAKADGRLGDGWWPGTREWLRANPPTHRTLGWFYSGQINNLRREELHAALTARLATHHDGSLHATGGFATGMPRAEYLEAMAAARVAPCPSGCYSPDTFRLFEALEAGCVPVVDAGVPDRAHPDYWRFVFHVEPPFPIVGSWSEAGSIIDGVASDWPHQANMVGAWWSAEKRHLAGLFQRHLRDLSGWEPPIVPDNDITVLVPVSPIPTHPESVILDETLASVRKRLPLSEIILMFDGVRDEQQDRTGAYREHIRRVIQRTHTGDLPGVLPLVFATHHHQAAMTREALNHVRTPLILFVEQDTPLVGDIPFDGIARVIQSGEANVVRLHHEAAILEPHQHLMLDTDPQEVWGVRLLRTVQWSQRPHLASSTFYREMIARYFGPGARSFIEDIIHGVVQNLWSTRAEAGWRHFRLWLYAPPGDMKRSTHLDGRAGDPKFSQTWEYPTPSVPTGAPTPRVTVVRPPPPHGKRPQVKWGLLARADRRGLAIQTTEIARHLEPDRVLGIDMGHLSPYRPDWSEYDPERLTIIHLSDLEPENAAEWMRDLEVVVSAETFYRPWWTRVAAQLGVATVLAPNPEFFAHVIAPDWAPLPDVMAPATRWRIGEVPGATHLPHGVDRQRLQYRQRTEARTFLHIIGHAAKWDRAGTRVLWDALRWVTEDIHLVIRSQTGASAPDRNPRVTVETIDGDIPHYWDLYDRGDVMILPRRYGGLCLPMQEALSCGMPVLMPDASPQASVLPPEMLLPCVTERTVPSNVGPLPVHDADPKALGERISWLAANPPEVEALSKEADRIAATLDWENLASTWCGLIERAAKR